MTDETYEPGPFALADPEAAHRMRRLGEIGIGEQPDPEFDAFARRISEFTSTPYALVNFIGTERQYLGGLHAAATAPANELVAAVQANRMLPPGYGYCPHVVVRRKALVLDDVCDYPRFAGNPVVDDIGIRSYLGAPLIDRTQTVLGTICVVDVQPRAWGRPGLGLIKSFAAELVAAIDRR